MITFGIFFLGVLLVSACLGVLVFQANPRRTINQFYLILSIFITLWLTSNWYTLNSLNTGWAKLSIQIGSAFAAMIPMSGHLLRISILHTQDSFNLVLYRARLLILTTLGFIGLCFTNFFLSSVTIPHETGQYLFTFPEPIYGPGFAIYVSYFTLSLAALIFLYFKDRKRLQGSQRIEMEFVALGSTAALLVGILLGMGTTMLIKSSRVVPFSNAFSILVLTSIIGYGIATRRIMGVAYILQRLTAYVLLVGCLGGLYFLTLKIATAILPFTFIPIYLNNFIATLVTVFAMAPARGRLRTLVNKLFQSRSLDVAETLQEATGMLQSLAKTDEILRNIADFLSTTFNAERVMILLADHHGFREACSNGITHTGTFLEDSSPLIGRLRESREPCSSDILQRFALTPENRKILGEMQARQVSLAAGLHFKGTMNGVLLISSRLTGRVYDRLDMDMLQILCNELAIAVENSKLYTQVQDGRIYDEILLDNIVSGIIAVNTEGIVTVFNREAQRITLLAVKEVLLQPLDMLPATLAMPLRSTLMSSRNLRDADAELMRRDGTALRVTLGTSVFCGYTGNTLGALIVLHDQTTVRQLEEQVRRSDRLASVGTLAASMAHEIKNPLVALKTFAQLLPERYEDPDFRDSFSNLVGREVTRIDSIVNQLLKFSRPVQPSLMPMNLHHVLEHTLNLVQQQLNKRGITMHKALDASCDLIQGNHDLLVQALLNFYLNALEAMEEKGVLSVRTENVVAATGERDLWGQAITSVYIRVIIQDNGKGFSSEVLACIFDPFYTTKADGTGLGLSVAHGIIQEHAGAIEVESTPGLGTTFYLRFPVIQKEKEG